MVRDTDNAGDPVLDGISWGFCWHWLIHLPGATNEAEAKAVASELLEGGPREFKEGDRVVVYVNTTHGGYEQARDHNERIGTVIGNCPNAPWLSISLDDGGTGYQRSFRAEWLRLATADNVRDVYNSPPHFKEGDVVVVDAPASIFNKCIGTVGGPNNYGYVSVIGREWLSVADLRHLEPGVNVKPGLQSVVADSHHCPRPGCNHSTNYNMTHGDPCPGCGYPGLKAVEAPVMAAKPVLAGSDAFRRGRDLSADTCVWQPVRDAQRMLHGARDEMHDRGDSKGMELANTVLCTIELLREHLWVALERKVHGVDDDTP